MTYRILDWKIHNASRELKESNTTLQAEFWIVLTQVRSYVFSIQDSVSHRIGNPVWIYNRTAHFFYTTISSHYVLRECVSSGEDVSVNTVIILRNWRAILADLRSEATEEASIAPQFWGMMTVFTDTSDPELMHSHCYNVNTTRFLDLWLLHMSILVLSTPTKKQYLLRIAFLGGYILLNPFYYCLPPQKSNTCYVLVFLGGRQY